MAYSSDVEQQLAQQQEEEQKRQAELEEIAQLERMAAMQDQESQQNGPVQQARDIAVQRAKQLAAQAGKKALAAGGRAAAAAASSVAASIGSILAATVWIWGPIVLILALGVFVFISLASACNSSYTDGVSVAALKLAVAAIPGDVCESLKVSDFGGGRSGGGGGGASFGWEPSDLVALSGVSIDSQASDPRVRQCMLGKVQQIFSAAQAQGLQVTITSGFRSGDFPSRHAYGEAVDMAIRPAPPNQQQIAKLVQIARNTGFTPPVGDTIDEYNNPQERTSGGHVHVEFNKISAESSNCAPYANAPAPI